MMRISLAILRKDLRRLWWEGAVSIGVLSVLTHFDAHRFDFVPGPTEAMLNFLAPAVWAYLIALLVHQESLVGDRQFWLTRPYPRASLLAAKLLGAFLLVHVPAFIADCVILRAHQFSPLLYLPQLAWKQTILAGVLTLPALALAAVTRNLPQFAFAAALAAAAGVLLFSGVEPLSFPWIPADVSRRLVSVGVLCVGAALMTAIQYRSRRTALARSVGGAFVLAAALLFVYLPPGDAAGPARASQEPGDFKVILASPPAEPGPEIRRPGLFREVPIPIEIAGLPDDPGLWLEQLDLRMIMAGGPSWRADRGRRPAALSSSLRRSHQILFLSADLFHRVANEPITLEGKLAAVTFRSETARLPAESAPVAVAGVGRCVSGLAEGDLLRVMCESPEPLPRTLVTLTTDGNRLGRQQSLGDSAPVLNYPLMPWLSPLNRRQTFFHLRSRGPAQTGDEWRIPYDAIEDATVELRSLHEARRLVSDYRLGPLRLADYLLPSSRGSMNLR